MMPILLKESVPITAVSQNNEIIFFESIKLYALAWNDLYIGSMLSILSMKI